MRACVCVCVTACANVCMWVAATWCHMACTQVIAFDMTSIKPNNVDLCRDRWGVANKQRKCLRLRATVVEAACPTR